MKKKLIAIIFLSSVLTFSVALAWNHTFVAGSTVESGVYNCSDDAFTPSGTGGQERFECGSNTYDDSTVLEQSTWSHSNTTYIDNADNTSPAPVQGDYSLSVTGAYLADVSISGTDGNQYVTFIQNNAETTCNTSVNRIFDLRGSTALLGILTVTYDASDCSQADYSLAPSGGVTSVFVENIATPHTNAKYIKILYNNGSGADAAWSAWYSADGSSWTAFTNNGTNDGVQTEQLVTARFREQRGDRFLFDDIRWDTADISY